MPHRPHSSRRRGVLEPPSATSRVSCLRERTPSFRYRPARLHVLHGQPGFEHDGSRRWFVGCDEHWRDDEVLTRRERAEVDQRRLQLERGATRAVIGLVDRHAAIRIRDERGGLVERVGV